MSGFTEQEWDEFNELAKKCFNKAGDWAKNEVYRPMATSLLFQQVLSSQAERFQKSLADIQQGMWRTQRHLVWATWALVIATFLLNIVTLAALKK